LAVELAVELKQLGVMVGHLGRELLPVVRLVL
jgi:hypothetical protein